MTKYTSEQKDQIRGMRDAFVGAIPKIGVTHKFICHALGAWGLKHHRDMDAYRATRLIERALEGAITLVDWQERKGHTPDAIAGSPRGNRIRREWLRKLIRDCDKAIAS